MDTTRIVEHNVLLWFILFLIRTLRTTKQSLRGFLKKTWQIQCDIIISGTKTKREVKYFASKMTWPPSPPCMPISDEHVTLFWTVIVTATSPSALRGKISHFQNVISQCWDVSLRPHLNPKRQHFSRKTEELMTEIHPDTKKKDFRNTHVLVKWFSAFADSYPLGLTPDCMIAWAVRHHDNIISICLCS